MAQRCNDPPPKHGRDYLCYSQLTLTQKADTARQLNEILSKAAQQNIPVLIRDFASIYGPMGRTNETKSIDGYLKYQASRGRPDPSCRVQGEEKHQNLRYDEVRNLFRTKLESREFAVNLLDNPIVGNGDLRLQTGFHRPKFISDRDVFDFSLSRPKDAYSLRHGVPVPSFEGWILVSSYGCHSTIHHDANGTWTAIEMQDGTKYWFWVESNEHNVEVRKKHGDFGGVSQYTKVFLARIRTGDLLVMPPGLAHNVFSEDSIAIGTHFWLRETLGASFTLSESDKRARNLTNDDMKDIKKSWANLIEVWTPTSNETTNASIRMFQRW